jgi:thymidylate synthase (FAD)
MKIVEPYAKIINFRNGIEMLQRIEYAARVSHRSEERQDNETWERFIRSVVLQHGDWSVTEHESVSVEFLVDRGITHEIVRHRHFSYTQESTRFVNYSKPGYEACYIKPMDLGDQEEFWGESLEEGDADYQVLMFNKVKPEIARSLLPNALASKLIMTGNLRAWRHFLIARTTKEAHPQMRQVVDPLLRQFQVGIPILYEDIVPGSRQVDAFKLVR